MANFYFPEAFKNNAIGAFIDGKLDAQKRMKEERDRQVDLYYRYQQLQMQRERFGMERERHSANLAKLKAASEAQKAFASGASNYGGYYGRRSDYDGDPNGYLMGLGSAAGGSRSRPNSPDEISGSDGQDFIRGGSANDDLSSGTPFARRTRNPSPVRGGGDGYPTPMSYEEAQALYGDGFDQGVPFDNPFVDPRAAPRRAVPRNVPNIPAPQVYDDPFAKPAPSRRPRRYDPNNTVTDEMNLAYFGGYY